MSQYKHSTVTKEGLSITVTLGYDRPLHYVFCIVMQEPAEDGQEEILYSNLDDEDAGTHCQDVACFRAVLGRLGIVVPESMYAAVESDRMEQSGNKLVLHE